MHNGIYFMTGSMFTLTRDGAEIFFFDVLNFRLLCTMQLKMEKEML
jgi:hypothetical protein